MRASNQATAMATGRLQATLQNATRRLSRIERGGTVLAHDYVDMAQTRTRLVQAMDARMAGFDALVLPTSPIVAPTRVPWGSAKAFPRFLGDDQEAWKAYDACALIAAGRRFAGEILVDQGDADPFLEKNLRPELLTEACQAAGQALRVRMQPGYDHSYYFISTFIEDHLRHHAAALRA